MDVEYIHNSMTNITPNKKQIERIEKVRNHYKRLIVVLMDNCEDSRERTNAITTLETALMWTIKSIVMEEVRSKKVSKDGVKKNDIESKSFIGELSKALNTYNEYKVDDILNKSFIGELTDILNAYNVDRMLNIYHKGDA